MNSAVAQGRVLSGMRPTGQLHLGNYHGALKNWVQLQQHHECYFFVADWHALTTGYAQTQSLQEHVLAMVVDWLAAGLDPERATIFVQSDVPEHAELHLLLSMITPLPWLERVPTYKDQQTELKDRDLSTYGFLGYPLLQSADILVYRPDYVPVGEDQVAHVEITREIARRFNFIFGADAQFQAQVKVLLGRLPAEQRQRFQALKRRFQESGDAAAQLEARSLAAQATGLSSSEQRHLADAVEGDHHQLLPAPEVLLTPTPKVPGLDGRKMSKSYGNTLGLTEDPTAITAKLKTMQTDPARARRSDPGTPEKCPVWDLHKLYSEVATQEWVQHGCRSAGIGCLECKKPLIERVIEQTDQMRARAAPFQHNPDRVRELLNAGALRARKTAQETMQVVREAMHLTRAQRKVP